MKEHWLLEDGIVFLNHGSFGATPRAVLEVQDRYRAQLEREPVRFMVRELEPLLDDARRRLASFLGADPEGLAFVPNATAGVNAVLRSLPLATGDELLVTNQEYNACRNAATYAAERAGTRLVVADVPFPITTPDDVIRTVMERVTDRTRLVLVDHVTSPTAVVQPVASLVAALAARGIDTLVDGAHAPGMLALDVAAVGAAYYTGNLHKWVCAPKGAAFLHVRADRRESVRPTVISHGANSARRDRSRYHLEFDWTGTFDPTAWLAVPAAIDFMGSLLPGGWPELRRANHALALRARDILASALRVAPPAPDEMLGSMAALPLPDGSATTAASLYGDPLQDALLERFRIEVPVVPWPRPPKRLIRVSAQIYNEDSDYRKLAEALTVLLPTRT
jgi:isopenicillin-N epimerase